MLKNIYKSSWFLILIAALSLTILIFMAYQPLWQYHLAVDVWGFYYPRFLHFIANLSFTGIGENEYFPGAMFFFLIPGFSLIFGNTWQVYLVGLFVVNIILIIFHLYIYRKINYLSPYIFLAILLASGPIVLYRHDLFVSLFVLSSILMWQSSKRTLSSFLLGLATSIKIYPILILPYFLITAIKSKNTLNFLKLAAFFAMSIFLVFGLYLALGSSIFEVVEPMRVNSIKPVHVESLWGSSLTLLNFFLDGFWPVGKGEHGIFGIHPNDIFLPLNFYNYFWIIPITIFYIFLNKKGKTSKPLQGEIVFLIILLFVIFSKILTPQYLFWFIPFFPLIGFSKTKTYMLSLAIILLIALLTQYIYPLHYNELLGAFYVNGSQIKYYYILLLRNILLIILFLLISKSLFSYTYDSNGEKRN